MVINKRRGAAAIVLGVALVVGSAVIAWPDGPTATCITNPPVTYDTGANTATVNDQCVVPMLPPVTVTETVTVTQNPTITSSTTSSTTTTPTTTTTTPTSTSTLGQGFPDSSNTGVPAGVTLVSASGMVTLSTAGQTYENKALSGCIRVLANNVTIRNVRVKGTCTLDAGNIIENTHGNTGLVVTDTEVDGLANVNAIAIGNSGYSATRVYAHGTGDGMRIGGSNVSIVDSFITNLTVTSASHNDGIQITDGSHTLIRHNSILINTPNATSATLIKADFGAIDDVTYDNNLLAGGAWTLYGGCCYSGVADATNVSITDNQFSTRYYPKGGYYGPLTSTKAAYVVTGNVWSDGSNAGKTVS